MSFIHYDPDEWETVISSTERSVSVGQRRRHPDEVAKLKAERRQREEDEILRKADAIRASRAAPIPNAQEEDPR